jgi:hypothetical protein
MSSDKGIAAVASHEPSDRECRVPRTTHSIKSIYDQDWSDRSTELSDHVSEGFVSCPRVFFRVRRIG